MTLTPYKQKLTAIITFDNVLPKRTSPLISLFRYTYQIDGGDQFTKTSPA